MAWENSEMTANAEYEDNQGMTNVETAKAMGGVALTTGAAAASYAEVIEQYLRMGASLVAIISGLVVIWSVLSKHFKKRKKL